MMLVAKRLLEPDHELPAGFPQGSMDYMEEDFIPAVDITETDEEYRIQADVPGVDKAQIDVEFQDDVLTISGERKIVNADEIRKTHLRERSNGAFRRGFRFHDADGARIRATCENGVLEVIVPKKQDAVTRHIDIEYQGV